MESLWLLIPMSVVFVLMLLVLLAWAVRSGQFEDLDEQAEKILHDDEAASSSER